MNAYSLADKVNDLCDSGSEAVMVRIDGKDYIAHNATAEETEGGKVIVVHATKVLGG